jgi:hypothetical protein
MSARYAIHVPKVTEVYIEENLPQALEAGMTYRENEYDVTGVFRVEDDIKTPIAFFWNGQKFIPQNS